MPKTSILVPILTVLLTAPAAALTVDLPAKVLGEETRSEVPGSYALPTAAFDGQAVPSRVFEGALDQRAFQLDAPGATTLAVLAPLREQIVAAGFELLFECEARSCGGFDFRFGTDVMPEPEMHVDLGDFRFLSATKGDEAVSILVSRSVSAAYVQITRITDAPEAAAPVKTVIDLDEVDVPRGIAAMVPQATGVTAALDTAGVAVLDDLVFASGSASLADGTYASLSAIAAWLEANPGGTVALVGHTDASGSLAANIALSEQRAEAVVQVLVDTLGVDANRVASEGVGYLAPRASNQSDEGRQKNRRVEVIVTSTQ